MISIRSYNDALFQLLYAIIPSELFDQGYLAKLEYSQHFNSGSVYFKKIKNQALSLTLIEMIPLCFNIGIHYSAIKMPDKTIVLCFDQALRYFATNRLALLSSVEKDMFKQNFIAVFIEKSIDRAKKICRSMVYGNLIEMNTYLEWLAKHHELTSQLNHPESIKTLQDIFQLDEQVSSLLIQHDQCAKNPRDIAKKSQRKVEYPKFFSHVENNKSILVKFKEISGFFEYLVADGNKDSAISLVNTLYNSIKMLCTVEDSLIQNPEMVGKAEEKLIRVMCLKDITETCNSIINLVDATAEQAYLDAVETTNTLVTIFAKKKNDILQLLTSITKKEEQQEDSKTEVQSMLPK